MQGHPFNRCHFIDTFGEIIRLNRELLAAREELAGLRFQVPALQAAQEERDMLVQEKTALVEERAALTVKAEVLEVALDQARANAKWSYRRHMAKAARPRKRAASEIAPWKSASGV